MCMPESECENQREREREPEELFQTKHYFCKPLIAQERLFLKEKCKGFYFYFIIRSVTYLYLNYFYTTNKLYCGYADTYCDMFLSFFFNYSVYFSIFSHHPHREREPWNGT